MPPPPRQPGPRPEMVQMSGSLDPATSNASSADHVVQFSPRKPVFLGRRVLSFFARLGRQRFHRVARALSRAEVHPPSILFPYFALPCTILSDMPVCICLFLATLLQVRYRCSSSASLLPCPLLHSQRRSMLRIDHFRDANAKYVRRGAGQDWISHSSPTRWPSWQGASSSAFSTSLPRPRQVRACYGRRQH